MRTRSPPAQAGYNVNIPFPGAYGDAEALLAWEAVIAPALRAFAPDLVIVAAGFDAMIGDPLGQCAPGGTSNSGERASVVMVLGLT